MTNFLVFMSISLNIIALLCIIILYLRQNKLYEVERKQEKLINDMEEIISAYLIEMKEENEQFIKKVKNVQTLHNMDASVNGADMTVNETMLKSDNAESDREETLRHEEKQQYRKGNVFQVVQAYKNKYERDDETSSDSFPGIQIPPKNNMAPTVEKHQHKNEEENNNLNVTTLLDEVIRLRNLGQSESDIAKKLNKGKTEIELLLKFGQNKQ